MALSATLLFTACGTTKHLQDVALLSAAPLMLTQDRFVTGLHRAPDGTPPRAVFDHLFATLPEHIDVLPSEHYFYFRAPVGGRVLAGNFVFSPTELDRGRFSFYYLEQSRYPRPRHDRWEGWIDFEPAGSPAIAIRKLAENLYEIYHRGRAVTVRIVPVPQDPPRNARLLPGEIFVGNTQDESGLGFHLVFSTTCREFLWLLDEDHPVAESFVPLAGGLLMGARSRFGFFDDGGGRKILLGVAADEEDANTWYDGPFDQLPQAEIDAGRVDLRPFLDQVDQSFAGRVDAGGQFLDSPGYRVAIAPYRLYDREAELIYRIQEARRLAGPDRPLTCLLFEPGAS